LSCAGHTSFEAAAAGESAASAATIEIENAEADEEGMVDVRAATDVTLWRMMRTLCAGFSSSTGQRSQKHYRKENSILKCDHEI